MPRFYVKNKEEKWNVFSTDVNAYIFDNFIDYDVMEQILLGATVQDRLAELRSLNTDKPVLNVETEEKIEQFMKLKKQEELDARNV